jgi:hypothetical protein
MSDALVMMEFGLMFVIIILGAVEVAMLAYIFSTAQTIGCTLMWCEFTSTVRNETVRRSCYENGVPINCSSIFGGGESDGAGNSGSWK